VKTTARSALPVFVTCWYPAAVQRRFANVAASVGPGS